jgi:hypothetical protein
MKLFIAGGGRAGLTVNLAPAEEVEADIAAGRCPVHALQDLE